MSRNAYALLRRSRCFAGLMLLASLLIPAVSIPQSGASNSQGLDRPVEFDAKRAALTGILQDMAARYGVRAVADGRPLTAAVDFQFRGTLHDALDRLADLFDYTWTASKGGVILLNKRFKNPDDRPQLNRLELRQSAKDMLTALPQVEAAPDHRLWGAILIEIADSFTPEQAAALRGGKRLSAADLTPAQRGLLDRAILIRNYGVPRGIWERVLFQLENFETSVIRPADPAPGAREAGQRPKYYDVLYTARGKGGRSLETWFGQVGTGEQP